MSHASHCWAASGSLCARGPGQPAFLVHAAAGAGPRSLLSGWRPWPCGGELSSQQSRAPPPAPSRLSRTASRPKKRGRSLGRPGPCGGSPSRGAWAMNRIPSLCTIVTEQARAVGAPRRAGAPVGWQRASAMLSGSQVTPRRARPRSLPRSHRHGRVPAWGAAGDVRGGCDEHALGVRARATSAHACLSPPAALSGTCTVCDDTRARRSESGSTLPSSRGRTTFPSRSTCRPSWCGSFRAPSAAPCARHREETRE